MNLSHNFIKLFIWLLAILTFPGLALAQDIGSPDPDAISGLYPGKVYSPYAQRSFPSKVYWGETHLHTGLSLDAGVFGNILGPEDAYRFARGEEIKSSTGQPVKLGRPLDWLAVTDHTDMMGIAIDIQRGAPNILADPKGKEWAEGFAKGGEAAGKAAFDLITHFAQMKLPEKLLKDYSPGSPVSNAIWDRIVDAADHFNEPGRFTALIGYEWTSVPKGFNLHRNVILRDNGFRAKQVIPLTTQPPYGSHDPLDLYKWLEDYEKKTNGQALALAHNGNLSNGWMFPIDKTYAGGNVDENYVNLRAKWEPLYEATQIKGDGETHPLLSPTDDVLQLVFRWFHVLAAVLWAISNHTKFGLVTSASAENEKGAVMLGYSPERLAGLSFVAATVLSGFVAILAAPRLTPRRYRWSSTVEPSG